MGTCMHNLANVIATGFIEVYVKASLSPADRQAAIANLTKILESAYGHGFTRGQFEYASKLSSAINQNPSMSAQNLLSLASSLQTDQ